MEEEKIDPLSFIERLKMPKDSWNKYETSKVKVNIAIDMYIYIYIYVYSVYILYIYKSCSWLWMFFAYVYLRSFWKFVGGFVCS